MRRLFTVLLLFTAFLNAEAFNTIEVEKYTTKDGLSSNIVYRCIQDSKGFLWLATIDGLNRFDGKDFKVFRNHPDDSMSLAGNVITHLAEDRLGNLWIMTSNGMCKYVRDQNHFIRFKLPWIDEIESQYALESSLLLDGNYVWFTDYEGINRIDVVTHQIKRYPLVKPFKGRHLISLGKDPDNKIFAGSTEGTFELNASTGIFEKTTIPYGEGAAISYYTDSRREFWMTMWLEGALNYPDKKKEVRKYGGKETLFKLFEAGTDSFLACGDFTGLLSFHRNKQNFTPVKLINKSTGEREEVVIHSISSFDDDLVWMCSVEGLLKWDRRKKPFSAYVPDSKYCRPQLKINSMVQDPFNPSEIWISVWYQNLIRYNYRTGETHGYFDSLRNPLASLPFGSINGLFTGHDSTLYITGQHGIWKYNRARNDFQQLKREGFPESMIHRPCFRIIRLTNGNYLSVVRGQGMIEFNSDLSVYKEYLFRFPDMTERDMIISSFIETDEHHVLFCSARTGLYSLNRRTGKFRRITKDSNGVSMPAGITILENDAEGNIWVGTRESITVLDSSLKFIRTYNHTNGLASNHIQYIFRDSQNKMWVSTKNGLSLFEPERNAFLSYNQNDGMIENDCFIICELQNGDIASGHLQGISILNRGQKLLSGHVPQLQFTEIRIRDRELPASVTRSVTLKYGESPVQIRFASIDFFNAENISYSYKLSGASNEWVQLGNNNTVSFYELPPGSYRLLVNVVNAYGMQNNDPIELNIEIQAPFYLTWWFRLLSLVLTGGVIYSFYRVRSQKREELERIRARISRDLHDDIGSTLSSINILTRSAKKRLEENDHHTLTDSLEKIGDRTGRLLDNMNDIIWSVKPENDSLESLLARMREYASTILEAKKITFDFDFPVTATNESLSLDIKNNIYMIFKEAVNNCAKYSECSHVSVKFDFNNGSLLLIVSDNGKGFNTSVDATAGSLGGNGLQNMKKRAAESGGVLEINSGEGHGTTVTFRK